LQEIEEESEIRSQINLYKTAGAEQARQNEEMAEENQEEDFPEVQLEELMEDLSLGDAEGPSAPVNPDFANRHTTL